MFLRFDRFLIKRAPCVKLILFHFVFLKKVVKRIPALKGQAPHVVRERSILKNELRKTLVMLHRCSTTAMFDVGGDLFLQYWHSQEEPFASTATKLHASWLQRGHRLRRFYAGASPCMVINQCGLEATNGTLKSGAIKDADFHVAVEHITGFLANHSAVRAPDYVNARTFEQKPRVLPSLWVEALGLATKIQAGNDLKMLKVEVAIRDENHMFYVIADEKQNKTNKNSLFYGDPSQDLIQGRAECMVLRLVHNTWTNLTELVSFFRDYYIVGPWMYDEGSFSYTDSLLKDKRQCHCEAFTREFVCQHELGLRLYLKEVELPEGIAQFKHKGKRGRGAPKKARGNGRYGSSLFDDADSTSEVEEQADTEGEDEETEAMDGNL